MDEWLGELVLDAHWGFMGDRVWQSTDHGADGCSWSIFSILPQTVYCWGSILERKELATLTGRAPELCG